MTLIVSRSDVRHIVASDGARVLTDLMDRIADGHRELTEGLVRQHPRVYLRYPEGAGRRPPGLFSMGALLPRAGIMGSRLLALSGVAGEGVLVLFDHKTLQCLAIIDDPLLHEYRTGASAGLASRYLARPDSRVLGCLGSSGIGRGSVSMVCCALPGIKEVLVYSPNPAHRAQFVDEMSDRLHLPVRPMSAPEEVAEAADVLITATDADRPVVADEAIKAGTHINTMARNEVSHAVLQRSRVVTAWRRGADIDPPLLNPIPESWVSCELADLITARVPGRGSDEELTVYLGGGGPPAMWDVSAAMAFYEAARRLGRGTEIDISG